MEKVAAPSIDVSECDVATGEISPRALRQDSPRSGDISPSARVGTPRSARSAEDGSSRASTRQDSPRSVRQDSPRSAASERRETTGTWSPLRDASGAFRSAASERRETTGAWSPSRDASGAFSSDGQASGVYDRSSRMDSGYDVSKPLVALPSEEEVEIPVLQTSAASCPFSPFRYVVWIRPPVLDAAQHWLRNADDEGEWRDEVVCILLKGCLINDIGSVSWVLSCARLTLLDLSECSLSTVGGAEDWEPLAGCLQVLYLNGNRIQDKSALRALEPLRSLICVTLFDNPLQGYRRWLAVLLPGLCLIDDYIVADAERRSTAQLPDGSIRETLLPPASTGQGAHGVFQPLSNTLHVPPASDGRHPLPDWDEVSEMDLQQREGHVLEHVGYRCTHVPRLSAALNPSSAIQRVWRGYRVRKQYAADIWRARKRAAQLAQSPPPPPAGVVSCSVMSSIGRAQAVLWIQTMWRGYLGRMEALGTSILNENLGKCYIPASQLHLIDMIMRDDQAARVEVSEPAPFCVLRLPHGSEGRMLFPPLLQSSGALLVNAARPPPGPPPACHTFKAHKDDEMLARRLTCLRALLNQGSLAAYRQQATMCAVRRPGLARQPPTMQMRTVTADPAVMAAMVNAARLHRRRLAMMSHSGTPLSFYFHTDANRLSAGLVLQSFWRGYSTRKRLKREMGFGFGDHIDSIARSFYAMKIQAMWRRWIAQRRASFLRALYAVVSFASQRGAAPPRPQTEACLPLHAYQQLMRMRQMPADVGCLPEHTALKHGLVLNRREPRGQCVSVHRSALALLPQWLRKPLASNSGTPVAGEETAPEDLQPLSLVMCGARIAHAAVPSSKSFVTLLQTPDVIDLARYGYGYLCLRYCSREEALRRGIALAGLTWQPGTGTVLCFEPPALIVHSDAAQLIQSWWIALRELRVRGVPKPAAQATKRQSTSRTPVPESGDSAAAEDGSRPPSRPASALSHPPMRMAAALRQPVLRGDMVRSAESEVARRLRETEGSTIVVPQTAGTAMDLQSEWIPRRGPVGAHSAEQLVAHEAHAPMELVGSNFLAHVTPGLLGTLGERRRQADATAHRERLKEYKERREQEHEELRDLVRYRRERAGALWRDPVEEVGRSPSADSGAGAAAERPELPPTGVVSSGGPLPSDATAPQLKLSAALRRFAEQAKMLEQAKALVETETNGAEAAAADCVSIPHDVVLTPQDLRWLSCRELSTFAKAQAARADVRISAEVGVRRALRSMAKERAREWRKEAAAAIAQKGAEDRQARNKALWQRWCDDEAAKARVLQRRKEVSNRRAGLHTARSEAANFVAQHNVVALHSRKRRLLQQRTDQKEATARRTRQLINDTKERTRQLHQWRDGEKAMRCALSSSSQVQLAEAARAKRREQLAELQEKYRTAKEEADEKRKHWLQRFDAVPAKGEEAKGRWQQPVVFDIADLRSPGVSPDAAVGPPPLPAAAPAMMLPVPTDTDAVLAATKQRPSVRFRTPSRLPPPAPPQTARPLSAAAPNAHESAPHTARPFSAAPATQRPLQLSGHPPGRQASRAAEIAIPQPPAIKFTPV